MFTDDDLRYLKMNGVSYGQRGHFDADILPSLVARLEAAERVCEIVDSEILDTFPSLEYRLGPWRKAAGKEPNDAK